MDNLDNKIHKTMGILFAKIMILKDDRIWPEELWNLF
jgi:hypothetical protein